MFIIYCLALLLFVYLAPALALFPKLVLSSRTIVAVPFISIAVVCTAQLVFVWIGSYTQPVVVIFSLILLAIAMARLILLRRLPIAIYWPSTHRYLLLFCLLLGIYWAASLGSRGFDTDDEIYRMNYLYE